MIYLIIKLICFSWVFNNFRPIQDILEQLRDDYQNCKGFERVIITCTYIIKKVFTCLLCTSFWFSLVYTQDIFIASIVAVGSVLIEKIINWFPDKL